MKRTSSQPREWWTVFNKSGQPTDFGVGRTKRRAIENFMFQLSMPPNKWPQYESLGYTVGKVLVSSVENGKVG